MNARVTSRTRIALALLSSVLSLAGARPSRAAAAEPWRGEAALELPAPAGATHVAVGDFDGDGTGDVLLVAGRRGHWFRGGSAPRTGRAAPDAVLELDGEAVLLDVGAYGAADALFSLGPEGARVHRLVGGAFAGADAVVGASLSLALAAGAPALAIEFLVDVDGRHGEDFVVPVEGGYRVLLREEPQGDEPAPRFADAGLVPALPRGSLAIEDGSDLGALEQTVELPRVFAGNVAGDARPELLTFDGRSVSAWQRGAGERWQHVAERELYTGQGSLAERLLSSRNVRVDDLDGDGRAALLVVRAPDREIDFFWTPGGAKPFDARATLRLDGFVLPPKLADLDGDGRVDLLAPVIDEIGPLQALRIFASGAVKMRYAIFRNRPDVRFARTPDAVREIPLPLRYESGPQGPRVENGMIYTFDGDFTGDGVRDLVVKADDRSLAVHAGRADATFEPEPSGRITIPDTKEWLAVKPHALDLDGDARSDLLLHYEARAGGASAFHVYVSAAGGGRER